MKNFCFRSLPSFVSFFSFVFVISLLFPIMVSVVAFVISSLLLIVVSVVAASIIEIFSKLAGNSTLPPLKFRYQKTVFLDLDETLIHSVEYATPTTKYDFVVNYIFWRKRYVLKRPFVDEFLRFLNEKNFQVVIFYCWNQTLRFTNIGQVGS